jgi:pSer/pThr/pTyr-binding forkhead associated (FHA) protein
MIGELRIERDGAPPHTVKLDDRLLILGGAPSADIPLDDRRLSNQHCKLEIIGRQLVVTDLGTPEGTYARGQRISRLALEAGEDFFVGSTRITFSLVRTAVTSEPAGGRRNAAARSGVSDTLARPIDARLPRPAFSAARLGVEAPSPVATAAGRKRISKVSVATKDPSIEGYRIVRRLGEGSMGTAYLARSLETDAECVLKTIALGRRSETAIFFIREAQMGLKLRHPNIVRVLDFGESGGLLFLTMEYVEGGSLLDRIERAGPLGNAEALKHLIQLTNALADASHKKFVHRDIKPANILLTADGVPKLGDFGLAKMLSETQHAQLTRTGEARGTPMYMPPEILINAAGADTRADIYSLGATYYHALAGQHPFPPGSLSVVLKMVASTEPQRLEERNLDVHPGLAEVVRRMMRKRVEDRYPSPAALAEDLKRLTNVIVGS